MVHRSETSRNTKKWPCYGTIYDTIFSRSGTVAECLRIKPKVVEMKYDDLRRECLQFGDFHPDEAGDLATIVAAIVRKGLPFPNQLAIKMAEYIEDERHSRLRLAASAPVLHPPSSRHVDALGPDLREGLNQS